MVAYCHKGLPESFPAEPDTPLIIPLKGETMVRRFGLILLVIGALITIAAMNTQAQGQSMLTRHVREVTLNGQAQSVGRLPATQSMHLDVVLPLRNQAELDNFLRQLSDPTSGM